MFGNKPQKRKFNYSPIHAESKKKDLPLRERMKLTSFSSQEGRNTKKRTIILALFLIMIVSVIVYFGVNSFSVQDLKIKDEEFEKVTP